MAKKSIQAILLVCFVLSTLLIGGCMMNQADNSCTQALEDFNSCITDAGQRGDIKGQQECDKIKSDAGC